MSYLSLFTLLFSLFIISICTIIPSKDNYKDKIKEYKNDELRISLNKAFPLSWRITLITAAVSSFSMLILYFLYLYDYFYIVYLIDIKDHFIILLIFVCIITILSFVIFKEYKKLNSEIKTKRPYLLISIIFALFSLSGSATISFTVITNKLLDFSICSKEIVNVTEKYTRGHDSVNGQKEYYIVIEPPIANNKTLELTSSTYNSINKGNKIEINVHTGLLGIKYFTNRDLEKIK
ncbi:MAG: hypothetical protein IKO19_05320 [Candidatus Riflebacteria bacterium]|nr:hypothetical protein [Candidatus Riflebacteria bacterium]